MDLEVTIKFTLLTVALFASLGFAAPYTWSRAVDNTTRPGCSPTYNKTRVLFDFEDIYPPCYLGPCPPLTRLNASTPRGQGLAYLKYGYMERPVLIPNLSGWQAINCTWEEFADQDERFACANNSVKALYSPGKSPYDGSKPRLNTVDFPDTYITGAVESLYVTPLRLPPNSTRATFELTGIKTNGRTVTHKVDLGSSSGGKQVLISNLRARGFVDIKVLEFWLVVGGKGGYEFALDNLDFEEYRPLPRPAHCIPPPPTPITDPGSCKPPPTKTTFTANANDFPTVLAPVPTPYKSLYWDSWTRVFDSESFSQLFFFPPNINAQSKFYQAWSPFQLSANTYEQRFGVESLSIACGFWAWADPDYGGTNDSPCTISFVGRRDPYDGDGLPNLVIANYTIPNPGRDATTQSFTKINLRQLTNSPGDFDRLYAFTIYARIGTYNYEAQMLLDDIVLTRSKKLDPKCRVPGGQVLNFDDITVDSSLQKFPNIYRGFKFGDGWGINKKANYRPGTSGYKAVISPPNVLYSGWKSSPDSFSLNVIDSYIDPANNFLFDFEEATFTLDVPQLVTNASLIQDLRVSISVQDACGSGSSYVPASLERNPYWSYGSVVPEKLTFTYAKPLRAISSFTVSAWLNTGDFGRVEVFMDNFRYRKHQGPTPGCWACGRRGGDRCEVPQILPR